MKIEYVENTCNDLMVVNAARVSFNKTTDVLEAKDEKLITYLASHGHWTPFSHCRITFEVNYENFVVLDQFCDDPELLSSMVWNFGVSKVRHSLYGWSKMLNGGYVDECAAIKISNILHEMFPVSAKALGIYHEPEYDSDDYDVWVPENETDPKFIDVTMREKVGIFVARQRFKHMVGFTYNEVSRRYVDDTPEFYMPDVWRSRPDKSIKQGSSDKPADLIYTVEETPDSQPYDIDVGDWHKQFMLESKDLYEMLLGCDVAPEQARMVLPQAMYTEYYVTGSLRTWNRAYKQRIDAHAQKEIRDCAEIWDNILTKAHLKEWNEVKEG